MKRKIYSQLLTELSHVVQVRAEGSKAPSPGRVEQTCVYIIHTSDLAEKDGIVYLPLYMTPLL